MAAEPFLSPADRYILLLGCAYLMAFVSNEIYRLVKKSLEEKKQ